MKRSKTKTEANVGNGQHDQSSEIQFKPPNNLLSMRMIWLFILMRRASSMARLRKFRLTEIQWRIMTQLGISAPTSLIGLADRLLLDRGQVSRAVKELVRRGLVSQVRKPGGPELEISLSPEGCSLHAELVEAVIERDRRLTENLGQDELDLARHVVEQMIVHAHTLLEEEIELSD